jgi:hypothetical protein
VFVFIVRKFEQLFKTEQRAGAAASSFHHKLSYVCDCSINRVTQSSDRIPIGVDNFQRRQGYIAYDLGIEIYRMIDIKKKKKKNYLQRFRTVHFHR